MGCAAAKRTRGSTYHITCNYATRTERNKPVINFDENSHTKPGCECDVKSDKYVGLCGQYKMPMPKGPYHKKTIFAKSVEENQHSVKGSSASPSIGTKHGQNTKK